MSEPLLRLVERPPDPADPSRMTLEDTKRVVMLALMHREAAGYWDARWGENENDEKCGRWANTCRDRSDAADQELRRVVTGIVAQRDAALVEVAVLTERCERLSAYIRWLEDKVRPEDVRDRLCNVVLPGDIDPIPPTGAGDQAGGDR